MEELGYLKMAELEELMMEITSSSSTSANGNPKNLNPQIQWVFNPLPDRELYKPYSSPRDAWNFRTVTRRGTAIAWL